MQLRQRMLLNMNLARNCSFNRRKQLSGKSKAFPFLFSIQNDELNELIVVSHEVISRQTIYEFRIFFV